MEDPLNNNNNNKGSMVNPNTNQAQPFLINQAQIPHGEIKPLHLAATDTVANGDMYYSDGTNFVRLPAGSNGQVVTLANGVPSYATPSVYSPTMAQQTIGAASSPTGLLFKGGWNFVTGNTTNNMQKAITFTSAFPTTLFTVVITGFGGKNSAGAPTALSDFVTDWGVAQDWIVNSPATTGFTAINFMAATLNANQYNGFSWYAIGN